MDLINILHAFVSNGYAIFITIVNTWFIAWLVWDKLKEKRAEITILSLHDHITSVDSTVTDHLKKEAIEDIERGQMQKTIEFQGQKIDRLEEYAEKTFNMISELKNMLIDGGGRRRHERD